LGRSERWGDFYDAGAAADVMAKIVRAAGIARPFVYVGHSLGANFAEVYAAKYPKDVSALALLEPGVPGDLLEDFHGTRADAMALSPCDWTCRLGWIAGILGAPRIAIPLIHLGAHGFAGHPDELAEYRQGLARTATPAVTASFFAMVPKTAWQCADVKNFGDRPVLVVASSDPRQPEGSETPHDVTVWTVGQRRYFADLARKSSRGKGPVIVPHSTHGSMTIGPAGLQTAAAILSFAQEQGLLR
jgi:pimeloyl-ACP methyl ester carboxylesterase